MTTLNESSSIYGLISCELDSFVWCVLLHLSLILVTLVTVVGNLLVIISIVHFAQLRSPTNYLILSLAVADLLVGLLVFPLNMPFSLRLCVRMITAFCKIRFAVDFMISLSSILSLCCISIDRYYAVCQPLMYKSKMTDHMAGVMIAATWLLAFLCGTLVLIMVGFFKDCTDLCFVLICGWSFIWYYVPSASLVCIYLLIYVASQKQARSIENATSRPGAVASRRERKATKTLAIVVGLFLTCWIPLSVAYPCQFMSTVVVNLVEPLNWFALSNSMYNPFIYAFFYKWFRCAFRMIISGKIFQGNLAHSKLY